MRFFVDSTLENVGAESCIVIWIINVYFHNKDILIARDDPLFKKGFC